MKILYYNGLTTAQSIYMMSNHKKMKNLELYLNSFTLFVVNIGNCIINLKYIDNIITI